MNSKFQKLKKDKWGKVHVKVLQFAHIKNEFLHVFMFLNQVQMVGSVNDIYNWFSEEHLQKNWRTFGKDIKNIRILGNPEFRSITNVMNGGSCPRYYRNLFTEKNPNILPICHNMYDLDLTISQFKRTINNDQLNLQRYELHSLFGSYMDDIEKIKENALEKFYSFGYIMDNDYFDTTKVVFT